MQEIPMTADGLERLAVASLTDVGCVRENNEDSSGVFPGRDPARGSLLVVADGMGGAAGGEVASGMAVEEVAGYYFRREAGEAPAEALAAAFEAANGAIFARAREEPALRGMGTTCTAVAVVGGRLWFAHVGDSRAYLVQGGEMRQITRDHSLGAELERQGSEALAPARVRHVLTRCLGVKPRVEVDRPDSAIVLGGDAVVILCSDGLSSMVPDGEILSVVSRRDRPEEACRDLVRLAKDRGAPDNITVQVGRVLRG